MSKDDMWPEVPPAPKKYSIEKITDILQIPEDSFDNFLIDLKEYYLFGKSMNELVDALGPLDGVDPRLELKQLVWIDDGKHDMQVTTTLKIKKKGNAK